MYSLPMGLSKSHKHPQALFDMRGERGKPTSHPSPEPYCSMSRPGKTRGLTSSFDVCLFDPKLKLIDASPSLEVGLPPSLEVPNEATLKCVNDPVAVVARLARCGERPTHLRDLLQYLRVSALICLVPQLMLAHVWAVFPCSPTRCAVPCAIHGTRRWVPREPCSVGLRSRQRLSPSWS